MKYGLLFLGLLCPRVASAAHLTYAMDHVNGANKSIVAVSSTVFKCNNESVTESTTLQVDDKLQSGELDVHTTYFFEFDVGMYSDSGSPDIKWQFEIPLGSTISLRYFAGKKADSLVWGSDGDSPTILQLTAGTESFMHGWGFVQTLTTKGQLRFLWAQNNSNAVATTVIAPSTLKVIEHIP